MPQPPSGEELDRSVALAINADVRRPPVAYSSDPAAAARLLSYLSELGLAVEVENADGLSYCTLFVDGRRVATGSGETKALAVARAVVNCRFPSAPGKAPLSEIDKARTETQTLSATPRAPSYCADCGVEVRRMKKGQVAGLVCNLCSWKRVKSGTASPRPETSS